MWQDELLTPDRDDIYFTPSKSGDLDFSLSLPQMLAN